MTTDRGRAAVPHRQRIPAPPRDQPQAIDQLVDGLDRGYRMQTMLGATGSGKDVHDGQHHRALPASDARARPEPHPRRPAHGRVPRRSSPDNSVEYFVSYYDYYQPEAYLPRTDTYIAKDADINDEIDKMRHSATRALFERRDVVIVASVSCIYGLGEPGRVPVRSSPTSTSAATSTATRSCGSSWRCSTSATT